MYLFFEWNRKQFLDFAVAGSVEEDGAETVVELEVEGRDIGGPFTS